MTQIGTLRISVCECENKGLPTGSSYLLKFSLPDKLCKPTSFGTKDAKPDNLEAVNTAQDCVMLQELTNESSLHVELFQHATIGFDKKIGETDVGLSCLFSGKPKERISDLKILDAKNAHMITFKIDLAWNGDGAPRYITRVAASGGAAAGPIHSNLPGEKLEPLPSPEGRTYTVRVLIRKAKNLQSTDENALYDPLVAVTVGEETQKTDYVKQTNEPFFDEELMFTVAKADANFWSIPIVFNVMHHRIGIPNKEIGMSQLETQAVYRFPNHLLAHKWLILRSGQTNSQIMGFLKVSVMVLDSLNDIIPEVEEDPEDGEESEEAIIQNLVNTPGTQFEEVYLRCEIFKAQGLPVMDSLFTGGKADPFVKFTYGVKSNQTNHLSSTLEPVWDTVIAMPLQLPSLTDTISIALWDYDGIGANKIIATNKLSFASLCNKAADGVQLPMLSPRYISFYGSPRMKEFIKSDYFKAMDRGLKSGLDYRGRLLLNLKGSREKNCHEGGIQIRPTMCTITFHAVLQALQFSMIKNATFGVSLSVGSERAFGKPMASKSMIGNSDHLAAVYFGQEIHLESKLEVVFPTDDDSCGVAPQIPDAIVHLWIGDNMYAAYRVTANDLIGQSAAKYVCGTMRVFKDPEKKDEGEAPSDPLSQFSIAMYIKDLAFAPDFKPTPEQLAKIPIQRDVRMEPLHSEPAQKFMLECCVYRAQQVPSGDSNGLSDPFVRVSWANGNAQTGVKLETLNPSYDELIQVVAETKQPFTDIVVEMWDWDLIGANTFLGKAVVPIDNAITRSTEKIWLERFSDSRGKEIKDCRLLMSFEVKKVIDKMPQPQPTKFLKKIGSKETYDGFAIWPDKALRLAPFKLTVSLLGLRKMRPFRLLDVKNASVEVQIQAQTIKFDKTQGLNPNFNKEYELFLNLPEDPAYWPVATFRVYDHRIGSKTAVGVGMLQLQNPKCSPETKRALLAQEESDMIERLRLVEDTKKEQVNPAVAPVDDPMSPSGTLTSQSSVIVTPSEFSKDEMASTIRKHQEKAAAAASSGNQKPRHARTASNEPINAGPDDAQELITDEGDDVEQTEASIALAAAKKLQADRLAQQDEREKEQNDEKDKKERKEDDIDWYEKFDADESLKSNPEFAVARLGKIHQSTKDNIKVRPPKEPTAECWYGPFSGSAHTLELHRGWGEKKTRAGEIVVDMTLVRVDRLSDNKDKPAPIATRKPVNYLVHVYIVSCRHLAPMDHSLFGDSSDPYLILTLTNGSSDKDVVRMNLKEQRKHKTLNPDFFMFASLSGKLPTHDTLKIDVMDYDDGPFGDDLIGSTNINLEDRWYSPRGYNAYRDKHLAPGRYTERRQLRNDIGQIQGTIELWVDMFDESQKSKIPMPIDITPPPPLELELRCIVWNTRDVVLHDISMHGEAMTDIYVRCFLDRMRHDMQNTDVHYRSLDGSGNFNWRMNFRFLFEPRSKKIMPLLKKTSIAHWFRIRREAKKLDPLLHVQIFDNGLFPGSDDFIGEAGLHLMKLRPVVQRRDTEKFLKVLLDDTLKAVEDVGSVFSICCSCCKKKNKTEEKISLQKAQEAAVTEWKEDMEKQRKMWESEAKERLANIMLNNPEVKYTETQSKKLYDQFFREARRASQINIFESLLTKKKKASSDAQAKVKKNEQIPPVTESGKYWFTTRGPKGSSRVGDVQLSFQLVRLDALETDQKLAAGKGRSEPQALPEPDRPASSFFWLSSPFKSAVHILWKNYKKYIILGLLIIVFAIFLYVFLSEGVNIKAQKFFQDTL